MFHLRQPKTALVLSGGGSKGSYQIGVWRALRELNIKIDMVFGTSVGALNGAMVALGDYRNAENLWNTISTDDIFDIGEVDTNSFNKIFGLKRDEALGFAHAIVSTGGASSEAMLNLISQYIDESKLRKSKVSYGLVTTNVPSLAPIKLNIDAIPLGYLAKFIQASASCFPFAQICSIGSQKYIDGGCVDNMPIGMALAKGAKRIIAVDLKAVGFVKKDDFSLASKITDFKHISSHFDLGNFLSFDPKISERNMRYGYLDGLKAFGKLAGGMYTFTKGSISADEISVIDSVAKIFDVDKTAIYTRKMFFDELKLKILDIQVTLRKNPFNFLSLNPLPNISMIERSLLELSKKVGTAPLAVYIAQDLSFNGDNSIFRSSLLSKLLSQEISVAQYLSTNNLLEK